MEKIKKINPLISVIIPCYNIEKYISKTIDSILNQKFNNFEIILVDDGSIDNTGKILDEYLKKDNRIKVIHKKNEGVAIARNTGLLESNGEYIYFLDGDDYISTSYFEDMSKVILKNNLEIIISPYYIEKNNKKFLLISNIKEKYYNRDFILKNLFTRKICKAAIGTSLIKKEIIVKNNIFFNEKLSYSEDYHFIIRVFFKTRNFYYTNKPYFTYVQRKGSAINSKINLKRLDTLKALVDLENDLNIEDKILKNYFYLFYAISFIGNINVLSKQKNLAEENLKLYLKELSLYSKQLNKLKFIFEKEYFIYKMLTIIYLCSPKVCFFALKILDKLKERIIKN